MSGPRDWRRNRRSGTGAGRMFTSAVRAANILGVDKIRVFTGTRVEHPETAYPLIVKTMEDLIPIAEKGKVKLLIENENSQNIGTSPEVKAIMELLPSNDRLQLGSGQRSVAQRGSVAGRLCGAAEKANA